MATESLALFPLHTVLLPGAALGLRVFEARYLDLVRDCGRNGRRFGVCLIIKGEEVGAPASAAAFGTEAVIEDFGQGDDGLLTLQVRGARRFHVERTRVRDNGLQVADVRWCPDDASEPVQPEHGLLPVLLDSIIEKLGSEHAKAARALHDDAAWVGWRLAELLPLHDSQRQELLQMDEARARLDRLLELVS
ncbi:LON peptidase substrate-binding domain-containing protein [Lysobacter solisilvae (ex Woo and Kim 2020)]|uniref:LON peptidase substrate-binding domain-containing protein n=1 Tax=Agrilutibacter terrestris TaxID=2865112 RepID=A0A7H0FZQ6_9GAMM|nr:LON peptidase substrate-binding domain-containing protein [Lysobacter terrestris]QNP41522.1 LON peptidase substrate-binding domain-containing protein [Lysobacter terrestris]